MKKSEQVFLTWLRSNTAYRDIAEEQISVGKMSVLAGVLLTAICAGILYQDITIGIVIMAGCGMGITLLGIWGWYRGDKAWKDALYKRAEMLREIFKRDGDTTAKQWQGFAKQHMSPDEWTLYDKSSP